MKFSVKWIINGNINIESSSKEEAERQIKQKLENIINNNKPDFEEVGAAAIQGSANLIKWIWKVLALEKEFGKF